MSADLSPFQQPFIERVMEIMDPREAMPALLHLLSCRRKEAHLRAWLIHTHLVVNITPKKSNAVVEHLVQRYNPSLHITAHAPSEFRRAAKFNLTSMFISTLYCRTINCNAAIRSVLSSANIRASLRNFVALGSASDYSNIGWPPKLETLTLMAKECYSKSKEEALRILSKHNVVLPSTAKRVQVANHVIATDDFEVETQATPTTA